MNLNCWIAYRRLIRLLVIGCVACAIQPNELDSAELTMTLDSPDAFIGRWAMSMPNGHAGWLSISKDDDVWHAELWTVGQAKAITEIELIDDELHFTRRCRVGPAEYSGGPETGPRVACRHRATVNEDTITVELENPSDVGEKRQSFTGKRMPPLPSSPDLSSLQFGEPIHLFNGENLDGWVLTNPNQENGWEAVDGELINTTPKLTFDPFSRYGNLRTEQSFSNFQLSIEFNVPPGGNSGIYLCGRYEAQVVDRDSRMQGIQGVGAIFGRIEPSENAGRPGDEWQTYDITLVDRHVTVILNGVKVIDNQPIVGCTNGAISADETIPGPLYLQGDHTAVRYRNIVIRPVVDRIE